MSGAGLGEGLVPLLGENGAGQGEPETPPGAVYVRLAPSNAGEFPTLSVFTWYRVVSIDPLGDAWIDAQDDDGPLLLPADRIGAVQSGQGTHVPASWARP